MEKYEAGRDKEGVCEKNAEYKKLKSNSILGGTCSLAQVFPSLDFSHTHGRQSPLAALWVVRKNDLPIDRIGLGSWLGPSLGNKQVEMDESPLFLVRVQGQPSKLKI